MICKALEDAFSGGIQTHVSSLTCKLISNGNQVTILTAGNQIYNRKRKHINGAEIITLPYFPKKFSFGLANFLGEMSFNFMANKWIQKHIKEFDLIHVQGRSGIMIKPKSVGLPVVTTVHRLMSVERNWNQCDYTNPLDRFLHLGFSEYFESRILKNSAAIITVSQNTKTEILSFYNKVDEKKIEIIPNGVDIPIQLFGGQKLKNLLFVGRLTKVKGAEVLVEAMRYTNKNIKLSMIGEGPISEDLKKLVDSYKLGDRIEFLGPKTRSEVYSVMSSSYALVLPSFHESQGIVMLEANAHSLPVIATRSSGITEFISNGINGLLFTKGSYKDMAKKINRIYNEPELATGLGENGRKIMIDEYGWDEIAKSTLKIYDRIAC